VARGAAYADIDIWRTRHPDDHECRPDASLSVARAARNQSLRVKLVGTKSNRDGIGAVVRIKSGSDKYWLMMKSGSSYLSQSDLVLTFGLGRNEGRHC